MPEENSLSNLKTLVVSISRSNCSNTATNSNGLSTAITQMVISVPYRQVSNQNLQPNVSKLKDEAIANKRKMSKMKWKTEHQMQINASERERKGRLAANIKKLKDIIPLEPIKLQTKEAVLEESLKYIYELKAKVEQMLFKDAPENLVEEIERLRKKVSELETEKKFFLRILQSHGLLHKPKVTVVPISKVQNSVRQSFSRKHTNVVSTSKATATSGIAESQQNTHSKENSSKPQTKETTPTSDTTNSLNRSESSRSITSTVPCSKRLRCDTGFSSANVMPYTGDAPCNFETLCSSVALPQFDHMFRHSNSAFCSPTYSMARMKPESKNNAPTLCTMLTKSVHQNEKSVDFSIVPSKTNSPASLALSSSSITANPGILNSSMQNSASPVTYSTSSSDASGSLRSWLGSCKSPSMSSSNATAVVATTSNLTPSTQSLLQNFESNKSSELVKSTTTTTIAGRKETHSFNIASLMKSKESAPVNSPSACVADTLSVPLYPSKNQQLFINNGEFSTSTPRDVFHQSFDNDLIECLQNIQTLVTPEFSSKSSASSTGSVIPASTDWVNLGVPTSVGKATTDMHSRAPSHMASIDSNSGLSNQITCTTTVDNDMRYSLRYSQQPQAEGFGIGQFEARLHSVSAYKTRPAQKSSFSSNSHLSVSYFNYVTATTSVLWQPAINACPRHDVSNASASGCFSPISSFTNNHFLVSQNCTSISNSLSSMTSSCQNNFESAPIRILSNSNHSASSSNFEHPKKRKFQQLAATKAAVSKRKKPYKPVQEHEDTHSISRLIGFQNHSASPHLQICEQSQRYMNPNSNISYENERNTLNCPQIFPNAPGPTGIAPSGVGYGNYPPHSNLFHSNPAINSPRPSYRHPSGGYFYNHPVVSHSQQPPGSIYMPGFANINNNNSSCNKHHKGSQHHIRQILS